MKSSIPTICAAFISVAWMASCSPATEKEEPKDSSVDSVSVFILKKEQVSKQMIFPAELIPMEKAELYAKVGGYIRELRVDLGDRVGKGQVLATIDAPEILSNLAQANSDVASANSKYQASLDIYKRIFNASKVSGTIATGELEKARNQMMSDSSSYEAARARLDATAQLKEYLAIRSPFAGIVTQRNADTGTLVGSGNAKPILVVENVNSLRLRIPVPEAYTAAIPDTTLVRFSVDAQPGKTFTATLSRKSGAINPANRTETWEFTCQNTDGRLKSGMYANAILQLGREDLSFLVPTSAIATNQERKFVIRLKKGISEWIDVKSGISQNDKIEIFGLLTQGDTLLVRATDETKPDTRLIPVLRN